MKQRTTRQPRPRSGGAMPGRRFSFIFAGVIAGGVVLLVYALDWNGSGRTYGRPPANRAVQFTDARSQAAEFVSYHHSIDLTHEQQEVMDGALTSMRAPCCNQYSMATCCCPCNFAKSVWGLSKFLIASHGYDADEVRYTVEEWVRFINPIGYSGDVCSTKGCNRPFEQNGCGGMDEAQIRW